VIEVRLSAFTKAHQGYMQAHRKVEAADTQLRVTQVELDQCNAVQDEAVETLARALITDGQPRGNPFAVEIRAPPWS
jgi:hypothetical protein